MNFRANSLQPVAGATGAVSCVQLPTPGRIAIFLVDAGGSRALPVITTAALRDQQRNSAALHRTQHRAQCRANCMSKANF